MGHLLAAQYREYLTTKIVKMDTLERIAVHPIPVAYYKIVRDGAIPYLINQTIEGVCAGIRYGIEGDEYISLYIDQRKAKMEWDRLTTKDNL